MDYSTYRNTTHITIEITRDTAEELHKLKTPTHNTYNKIITQLLITASPTRQRPTEGDKRTG